MVHHKALVLLYYASHSHSHPITITLVLTMSFYDVHPPLKTLNLAALSAQVRDDIEKDIDRTYPEHTLFKGEHR